MTVICGYRPGGLVVLIFVLLAAATFVAVVFLVVCRGDLGLLFLIAGRGGHFV